MAYADRRLKAPARAEASSAREDQRGDRGGGGCAVTATEAWEKQMEKTCGALVAEVGKARAERFFPRVRGKKGETTDAAGEGEKQPG